MTMRLAKRPHARRCDMKKMLKLLDLGRATRVTRSGFIGNRPEVANPVLFYVA